MFTVNAICTNIEEDWYHKNNILYWSGDFVYLEIAGEIKHICWQNKKGILFIFLSLLKVTQNVAAADLRFSGSGSDFSKPQCSHLQSPARLPFTVLCPIMLRASVRALFCSMSHNVSMSDKTSTLV